MKDVFASATYLDCCCFDLTERVGDCGLEGFEVDMSLIRLRNGALVFANG